MGERAILKEIEMTKWRLSTQPTSEKKRHPTSDKEWQEKDDLEHLAKERKRGDDGLTHTWIVGGCHE